MTRITRRTVHAAGAAAPFLAGGAQAQGAWPAKSVRWVVPKRRSGSGWNRSTAPSRPAYRHCRVGGSARISRHDREAPSVNAISLSF